jgi:hypothetical protein
MLFNYGHNVLVFANALPFLFIFIDTCESGINPDYILPYILQLLLLTSFAPFPFYFTLSRLCV